MQNENDKTQSAKAEIAFNKDLSKDYGLLISDLYAYKLGYLQGGIDKDIYYLQRISDFETEIKRLRAECIARQEQLKAIVDDRDNPKQNY